MDKLALFINTAMLAMFVENAIFSRALGTSVAFYASRKKESIFGLGLGITYVIVVSSCITFFIDGWLADWQYFYVVMPLIYTLTVSIVYTGSLLLLWRFLPKIFRNIKKYVHLSVFNAAVLGALFLNTTYHADFFSYMGFGVGIAAGFHCGVLPSYCKRKAQFSAYSRGLQRNADNDGFCRHYVTCILCADRI